MTRRVVAGVLVAGPWTCLDLLVSIMCRWVRRGVSVSAKLIQKQRGPGRFGRQTRSENIYAFDRRLQHWGSCEATAW